MKVSETAISNLIDLLKGKPEVLITTHYNPDGDAIGSSLALYHVLNSIGIHAQVLIPNELPSYLLWMPGVQECIIYSSDQATGNELLSKAEVIFCMDYNAIHRVKLFAERMQTSFATRVLIDHHIEPANEFDFGFSTTNVSSTSELLYHILSDAGFSNHFNLQMAECLFVGIMTDTGSFSYSCNNPETFEITAGLIRLGIDVHRIHRLVYDTYSESRMRLLGYCLGPRLKVIPEYSTAYIHLTLDDLNKYDYQQGDTEGVVNYALSIQGVVLAALFTERDDRIRVSLRSKGNFSVNELARTYFNGGGHLNAAGGDIFMPMPVALTWFESLLPEVSDQISKSLL